MVSVKGKRSPLVAKNKKQFGTFYLFYFISSQVTKKKEKKKRGNEIVSFLSSSDVSPTDEGEGETEPQSIQSEGGGRVGRCKKRADK